MSELKYIHKELAAAEAFVSPETSIYSDKMCAKEVRFKATSGTINCLAKYVASDFETEAHNDEFTLSNVTGVEMRQLSNAGKYRFEIANTSDAATAGVDMIISMEDNQTSPPIINKGIIKRFTNGNIRRST